MPDILSGVHGGSQTSSTSTAVPTGTIAVMTSFTWATIMSAIGQAAVVIVRSTYTASDVTSTPYTSPRSTMFIPASGSSTCRSASRTASSSGIAIVMCYLTTVGCCSRYRTRERNALRRRESHRIEESEQVEVARRDDRLHALDPQSPEIDEELRQQRMADAAMPVIGMHADRVEHGDRLGAPEIAKVDTRCQETGDRVVDAGHERHANGRGVHRLGELAFHVRIPDMAGAGGVDPHDVGQVRQLHQADVGDVAREMLEIVRLRAVVGYLAVIGALHCNGNGVVAARVVCAAGDGAIHDVHIGPYAPPATAQSTM